MGRLTEKEFTACSSCGSWDWCKGGCSLYEIYEKLKHYENLEEAGRLIELPCAVGDTVWVASPHEESCDSFNITDINITHHGIGFENPYKGRGFNLEWFGRTVFLTKEEAEAKLKELEG